jgi:peptide/nickel transport system substrate-binding protein
MRDREIRKVSRREFLRISTLAGGALAAAACGATAIPPTQPPAATQAPAATQPPAATAVPPTNTPIPVPTDTPMPPPAAGGTLNYAETGAFTSFNPWRMYTANGSLGSQVYARLLWKDLDGEEHFDMAEGMEMSADGLSLTVKLIDGIVWHDGKEATSQDWVDMYGYTKDAALKDDVGVGKLAGLLKPIVDVQALDKLTVKFVFEAPVPYISDILDYWYAVRIDDPADPNLMNKLAIGTGPFKMVEWVPNQFSRYVKNEQFYLPDIPQLDEWMFQRLERAETLIPNLMSGALQGIGGVPQPDVEGLQAEQDYWVEIATGSGSINNIIVNHHLPPFDKPEVRQALSYSLNRQAIVENVFYNLGAPTCSPFYSPASLAYREDLVNLHDFDLDKAAQLLAQAGVENLEMNMATTSSFAGWGEYPLIWQSDLAKIGVTLNVSDVEQAKFYEIADDPNLEGNAVHPWGTGRTKRDPAIFIFTQPQYVSPNKYGWENKEFEQLAEAAAVELDIDKRREMYQRCNEIYMEDLPMLQIMNTVSARAWSNQVEGATDDLLGYLTIRNTKLLT